MTDTTRHRQALLDRFAEALNERHDYVTITHAELSAAWPGNPQGASSLKQLLEAIGCDWTTDHREGTGDYVFRLRPSPNEPSTRPV